MGKLSDMKKQFDGRSSGIRKGIGIPFTTKVYSQLELFCRCCSLLQERQSIATLMHNIQSGILKGEAFLQVSEHYLLQILCNANYKSRYTSKNKHKIHLRGKNDIHSQKFFET